VTGSLRRFMKSLRERGLRTTLFRFYIVLADYFFDFRYGTDTTTWATLDDLTIEGDNKDRSTLYQASRIVPLKKLFNSIKPIVPENGVLVDIGCGKGRVLMLASQFGFRKAVGVEFAHELCEIARENCAVYERKTASGTEFQVVESDAARYAVNNDENVFFMFNPFDEVVMDQVLDNITASLDRRPRKILIVYCNPECAGSIERRGSFVKTEEFTFWGLRCIIYANVSSAQ